jgi:hypothetical protein
MFHHCLIVDCGTEGDKGSWCILDPFMDSTTYLSLSPELTALADQLDARRGYLPGLAVPIDLDRGRSGKAVSQMRGAFTRTERYCRELTAHYRELVDQVGADKLTFEGFSRSAKEKKLASYRFLCAKLKSQRAAAVLDSNFRRWANEERANGRELPNFTTLEQQIEYVELRGEIDPIHWFISSLVNEGMLEAYWRCRAWLIGVSHPALEIYADSDFALGVAVVNSLSASSGLSALSPLVTAVTSSQLIWHEADCPAIPESGLLQQVAREVSESFILGLPESRVHPLVSRRRRQKQKMAKQTDRSKVQQLLNGGATASQIRERHPELAKALDALIGPASEAVATPATRPAGSGCSLPREDERIRNSF